jgi:hypothetical protein
VTPEASLPGLKNGTRSSAPKVSLFENTPFADFLFLRFLGAMTSFVVPERDFSLQEFCRVNSTAFPMVALKFLTGQMQQRKLTKKRTATGILYSPVPSADLQNVSGQ